MFSKPTGINVYVDAVGRRDVGPRLDALAAWQVTATWDSRSEPSVCRFGCLVITSIAMPHSGHRCP